MNVLVSDLSFSYANQALVLDRISVEFRSNEVTFIAGASGSGKTSLIRCLNGLIPHRFSGTMSGTVSYAGSSVSSMSLLQMSSRVGTIMQDPERQMVSPYVMDEIAFGLENIAKPPSEILSRVRETASRLGIDNLLGRTIDTLSGGEKQKVAIASVIAMQPDTLLLDEPLASLDPASARETMAWFRYLADSGVAVIIAEHRHNRVLGSDSEHCLILESGRLSFDGIASNFPHKRPYESGSIAPSDPNARTLISIENVEFQYQKDTSVLANVNLAIRHGDIIAILGPNGAGKSTLCRHLIGLQRPTKGRILVNNIDMVEMTVAQIARQVGYVFQNPGDMLFEETLRKEFAFGPSNLGLPPDEIESRVACAAHSARLSERLDDSPFVLSFGEQKRAALASVLSMKPLILALDEPTAGQDCHSVQELMTSLLPLDGLQALIFATHDLDLARAFANRCIIMSAGRIVDEGEPSILLSNTDLLQQWRLI